MKNLTILFFLFLSVSVSRAQELIPYYNNGKYGYADKNMNIVIPCTYDDALPFFEGRALVTTYIDDKRKEFFVDSSGNKVFELKSLGNNEYAVKRFVHGVCLTNDSESLILLDKDGKEIKKIGQAYLDLSFDDYIFHCESFNQFGFYIMNYYEMGATHTKLIYPDGRFKKIDSLNLNPFGKEIYTTAMYGGKTSLIDTAGKIIIRAGLNNISGYGDGLVSFTNSKEKTGFLDLRGNIVIKPEFHYAENFSEGLAVFGVKTPGGDEYELKYGYINKKGKIVLPAVYDKAFSFSEGLADVIIGDSLFFIDKSGNKILRFKNSRNDDMFDFSHGFKNGVALIVQNDKIAWIDRNGDFIIYPMYVGMQLGSPIYSVYRHINGLSKIALTTGVRCFIDEEGVPYYEIPYSIDVQKENIRLFSAPDKDSLLNNSWNSYYSKSYVTKFTGKYLNENGKQSEWILIDGLYNSGYVLSSDFLVHCYSVKNKKGAPIYSSSNDPNPMDYVPFRYQYHSETEIPDFEKLSDDTRIAFKYYFNNYETNAFESKTIYILKKDIEMMKIAD
jgi:hypothetical protein